MATTTASFGSTFTISGTTPDRRNGPVRVEGSWNGDPWQTLGMSTAEGGAYSVSFPTREHGTLKMRVKYAGGEAVGQFSCRKPFESNGEASRARVRSNVPRSALAWKNFGRGTV
jgi:hypothetical protein